MKAAALIALLLAGCTGGPGATPPSATPAAIASATPTAKPTDTATTPPTATPSASVASATVYTPDDEQIAKVIRAGADEAIPELKQLNDSDPSKLESLFLPLGEWITSQRTGVEAFTPSSCTAPAVAAFIEGLDRYDAIRKKFLAWRDWGAQGHAFPVGAPRQAHESFSKSLAELEAYCPV